MAGSPKKRARREGIPDAIDEPNARPRNAPAHTPAYTRTSASTRAERPGPAARASADRRIADQLGATAASFGGGQTVSIERLRPGWCSGWLEDAEMDPGAPMGDLMSYIKEEWGGHTYKLTILGLDGTPLQQHTVKVAGPPRDEGRRMRRDEHEGPEDVPQRAQTGADPFQGTAMGLMSLIMTEARENRSSTLESVKAIQEASHGQVRQLIETMAAREQDTDRRASFVNQVREFSEGAHALNEVREELADSLPGPDQSEPAPGDLQSFATQKFAETMFKRFMVDEPQPQPHRTNGGPPPTQSNGARRPIPEAS